MKNLVVIDPYSEGSFHEVVAVGFLAMASSICAKVSFRSKSEYGENIQTQLQNCGLETEDISFEGRRFFKNQKGGGIASILNNLGVAFGALMQILSLPAQSHILFLNHPFYATPVLQIISLFFRKQIFIVCHNELEVFMNPHPKKTLWIQKRLLNLVFRRMKLTHKLNFIVLGDNIKNNLNAIVRKENQNRIFAMDLPYLRPIHSVLALELPSIAQAKIGVPSFIAPHRGLPNLNKLLSHWTFENIAIYQISAVSGETVPCKQYIKLNPGDKLMPQDIYTSYVSAMDALLFIYDMDGYHLMVSAAILEAIWNEKPIIALENEYFAYLFQKFGDMGVLCGSVEELISVFSQWDSWASKQDEWHKNLKVARTALLPENQASRLAQILEEAK